MANKWNIKSAQLVPHPYLNTVVAGGHAPVLHLHVGGRVGELALRVRAAALLPLVLPTHLQQTCKRCLILLDHVVQYSGKAPNRQSS